MPLKYRPGSIWPKDAGQDESSVLGDESSVVGDESESGSKLIEMIAGQPGLDHMVDVVDIEAVLERSLEFEVVIERL